MNIEYGKNNKERIPYEHYKSIFAKTDPNLISERCNLAFDNDSNTFLIHLMGEPYSIHHPSAEIRHTNGDLLEAMNASILLLRYLCEGSYAKPTGKLLTYRDIPWGEVYYPNFQGRCIIRLSRTFGNRIDAFEKAMEQINAQKIDMGDSAYKFAFINNLYIYFILWDGDDEFPASAQILFDDNFPLAFTAEDIAVVGDISIGTLKQIADRI